MTYPHVLSETKTLDLVLQGRSLARYGDGEFKHCAGKRNVSQDHDPELGDRLRRILHDSGECLVGIPNIHAVIADNPDTDKKVFWAKQMYAASFLTSRSYVSSLVTRPDSAPWINTPDYWERLETLWLGQDVTLVRGSGKSLTAEDLTGAREVREVIAPKQGAWADYASLLERVGTPGRALLCLGPTATVMAVDLCQKGVHAIDLGHVGMFLRKHRRGEPMRLSKDDKSHDKSSVVAA